MLMTPHRACVCTLTDEAQLGSEAAKRRARALAGSLELQGELGVRLVSQRLCIHASWIMKEHHTHAECLHVGGFRGAWQKERAESLSMFLAKPGFEWEPISLPPRRRWQAQQIGTRVLANRCRGWHVVEVEAETMRLQLESSALSGAAGAAGACSECLQLAYQSSAEGGGKILSAVVGSATMPSLRQLAKAFEEIANAPLGNATMVVLRDASLTGVVGPSEDLHNFERSIDR